jgi:hypothetical protein
VRVKAEVGGMKSYRLLSSSLLGCFLACAMISLPARAQSSNTFEWTWVSGDSIDCSCNIGGCGTITGVWGTLGVPAAANNPGSRISALSWTDSKGNLWLFGGGGRRSVRSVHRRLIPQRPLGIQPFHTAVGLDGRNQ